MVVLVVAKRLRTDLPSQAAQELEEHQKPLYTQFALCWVLLERSISCAEMTLLGLEPRIFSSED